MKPNTIKFIIAICCIVLMSEKAQGQGVNQLLANKLQTTLDSLTTAFSGNTKGASVAMYIPNQGAWAGASGMSYQNQPLNTDMIFGLASNSKLFVAVTMLKLAEDGILNLDDSLHEWITDRPNIDHNITIRQLLNHSSGIYDPFFSSTILDSIEANPEHVYTLDEFFTWIEAPYDAPGVAYHYSNTNYILAGMIAESATGTHISGLIRQHILNPLGMSHTFYDINEQPAGEIAHRWYNGVDWNDTSRLSLNTAGGCSGALFSNPSDMVHWYNALMNGDVINDNSLQQMLDFQGTGNYGLGIQNSVIAGHELWGHGGSTLGYKTRMLYDPCSKLVTCGLSNSNPTAIDGITVMVYQKAFDLLPKCPGVLAGQASVCPGEAQVLFTIPAIADATSYHWELPNGFIGNSNTNSILVNIDVLASSGFVKVNGENMYGAGVSATFFVTVNSVEQDLLFDGVSFTADQSADTYQWIDCNANGQTIQGETTSEYAPSSNSSYAVIMSKGGCVDTSNCYALNNLGLTEKLEKALDIYPNPFEKEVRVTIPTDYTNTTISLENTSGVVVKTILVGEEGMVVLDCSELGQGVYILRLKDENKNIENHKIVKR